MFSCTFICETVLRDATATEALCIYSFCDSPTKKPRRIPNCGANTPIPEPSLIS